MTSSKAKKGRSCLSVMPSWLYTQQVSPSRMTLCYTIACQMHYPSILSFLKPSMAVWSEALHCTGEDLLVYPEPMHSHGTECAHHSRKLPPMSAMSIAKRLCTSQAPILVLMPFLCANLSLKQEPWSASHYHQGGYPLHHFQGNSVSGSKRSHALG